MRPNPSFNTDVPRLAAAQFALVEPDIKAIGTQRIANALRRRRVLGRIAYENGVGRLDHRSAGTSDY